MDFFLPLLITKAFEHINQSKVVEPTTSSQKPAIHIPHLFVDSQESHSTHQWAELLSSSPSDYEHCRVVALTWGKALASDLSHEFIQFIVEDTRTGARTRCFSERIDEEVPDRVLVGRDYTTAYNPSKQPDLPMPLKSLIYNNNNGPPLLEFARMLSTITRREPEYHLYSTMCWWYAESVFESAKLNFGGEVQEWPFASFASKMIVWNLHFWSRAEMEDQARKFKQQNIEGLSYSVSENAKKNVTPQEHVQKVADLLKDEDTLKQYEEAMRVDGSEKLDPELLKNAVQNLEANVTKPSVSTYELAKASDSFTKTILSEADKNENLDAYDAAYQRNMRVEKNLPEDDNTIFLLKRPFYTGPGQAKRQDFEVAMRCFVGGVLREMGGESGKAVEGEKEAGMA